MNVEDIKPWLDQIEDYQLSSLYSTGILPRKYTIGLRQSYLPNGKSAGYGLFAVDPIPSGICVTLYPAHATGKKLGGDRYQMNVVKDEVFEAHPEYMLKTPTGDIICGYPELTSNNWFLGHIANDVADISCFRKKREYESAVLYSIMAQGANMKVEWYRGIPMMVTTRAIEANEELKWSYGMAYWFASLGFKDAEKRIASYVMRQPKAKREQMMTLLTNMKEIFEEGERLKTTSQ
jgi:hypothetical protein